MTSNARAQTSGSVERPPKRPSVRGTVTGEFGVLDALPYQWQLGSAAGESGALDIGVTNPLFGLQRLSLDLELYGRHHFVATYQPPSWTLRDLPAPDPATDPSRVDANDPAGAVHGIRLYRASYLYDFAPAESREIAAGLALEFRERAVDFLTPGGSGPSDSRRRRMVPTLKFRARFPLGASYWLGGEVDGYYPPLRLLSGGRDDVLGALLDASIRGGYRIAPRVDTFLNLRLVGGEWRGVDPADREPRPGEFTGDWLGIATFSLGLSFHF